MSEKTIKLLLIEDNPGDARLTLELLSESKIVRFTTQWVDYLVDGLASISQARFDAILLDLGLPDSEGIDTFYRVFERFPDTPILVLTGLNDSELAHTAVLAGAQDYLVKGDFSSHLLNRTITYAIERHRMKRSLQNSEARIRRIIEHNVDGIVVVNRFKSICFSNPTAKALLAQHQDIHENSSLKVPFKIGEVLPYEISNSGENFFFEIRAVGIDWENQPATLVFVRDVTEQKEMEAQLRVKATHDSLTGLPNRVLFKDRLVTALQRAYRKRRGNSKNWGTAVMLFDLDNFKLVNDNFGHDQGDIVLQEVADRLKSVVRKTDTVARLGGDEFTLIFENVNGEDDVDLLALKVLNVFDQPFKLEKGEVKVSASIGISLYPQHGENEDKLLKYADIAMYQAKQKMNTYQLFDPSGAMDE